MNVNNQPSLAGRVSDIVARLVSLFALIWLGLIVATNLAWLLPREPAQPTSATLEQPVDLPNLLGFEPGCWTFTDSPVSIRKSMVTTEQVREQLESLSDVRLQNAIAAPEIDRLIELLQSSGANRVERADRQVWVLDNEQVQFCLVATREDSPKLIAGGFAVCHGNQWELAVVQPAPRQTDHLLPMPADARIECARTGLTGNKQLEIFTVAESKSSLIQRWRSQGWQVTPTPWNRNDGFSYWCTRGEKLVYAWSQHDTGSRTLMLSSTQTLNKGFITP